METHKKKAHSVNTKDKPLHLQTRLLHGPAEAELIAGATASSIVQSTAFAYNTSK